MAPQDCRKGHGYLTTCGIEIVSQKVPKVTNQPPQIKIGGTS